MSLYYCHVDVYSLLSVSRLFPKLEEFVCCDGYRYEEVLNIKSAPRKEIYAPQFSKWTDLKTLSISTNAPHLPSMIIRSSVFTILDVSFQKSNISLRNDYGTRIKLFFEDIANLPALKVFKLAHVPINLDDMENLHIGAPNLERLTFYAQWRSGHHWKV